MPQDRPRTTPGSTAAAEAAGAPVDDPLDQLAEHLRRAADRAQQAVEEAANAARSAGDGPGSRTPPAGWQFPREEAETAGATRPRSDLAALVLLLEGARDLIPEELRARVAEALRELLLALRALIDWYLERVERRRAAPVEIEDIPIA